MSWWSDEFFQNSWSCNTIFRRATLRIPHFTLQNLASYLSHRDILHPIFRTKKIDNRPNKVRTLSFTDNFSGIWPKKVRFDVNCTTYSQFLLFFCCSGLVLWLTFPVFSLRLGKGNADEAVRLRKETNKCVVQYTYSLTFFCQLPWKFKKTSPSFVFLKVNFSNTLNAKCRIRNFVVRNVMERVKVV